MKRTPIDDFSTDELLAEIKRRVTAEERERKPTSALCDECVHFQPFGDLRPMPDDYNPCTKGHKMSFRSPGDMDDRDYGFYRRNCGDRSVPATQG